MSEQKIRTVIVEDESNSRELLQNLLSSYCQNVEVVGSTGSILEAEQMLTDERPNLLLLDIELEDGSGFDLLKKFDNPKFLIVFVSVYDQYGIKAIKHAAFDFILKPLKIAELKKTMHKVEQRLKEQKVLKLLSEENEQEIKAEGNSLVIKTGKHFKVLKTSDLIYINADTPYSVLVFVDEKTMVSSSLSDLEVLLPETFFRVHRSHIVNIAHVTSWDKGRGGNVALSDGESLPIAYRTKTDFTNKVNQYRRSIGD